jgi:hypothetical protein
VRYSTCGAGDDHSVPHPSDDLSIKLQAELNVSGTLRPNVGANIFPRNIVTSAPNKNTIPFIFSFKNESRTAVEEIKIGALKTK